MSYPCVDSSFFDSPAGVLSPKRIWQWQHRASATAGPWTFTPASNSGGTSLGFAQAAWLNNTGVTQQVFAQLTQGPQRYCIDGLKSLVIRTQWGTSSGTSPADPTMTETSQLRGYPDLGTGFDNDGNVVANYAQLEDGHPTLTVPIGDLVTLPAGQTMKARVQVSWLTTAWGIDWWTIGGGWGDPVAIRLGKVGAIEVSLFSVPVIP